MPRPRSWTDEQLIQAISEAASWRAVLRKLDLPVSSRAVCRMKGHALRLGLDVTHLGGAVATMPISSPAPLDPAAVAATVSSSMRWAEAIRKLGLAETSHNYKRIQKIAQAAGV